MTWRRDLKKIEQRITEPLAPYLPPRWLFRRPVVEWMREPELRRQLPTLYRAFAIYCGVYFTIMPRSSYLPLGNVLLKAVSLIRGGLSDDGYRIIDVGDVQVCADITDPRFLKFVSEIKANSNTALLKHFLNEGDTFIDVGANQGAFSVTASRLVGAAGKVIAFEPQERLSRAVEISLRNLPASYEVHQVALGDFNGKVDFLIPRAYSGTAGMFRDFSGSSDHRSTEVDLRRFDDVMHGREFEGELFMKLDIEGAEQRFLKGASETLVRHAPRILMEVNPVAMHAADTDPEELRDLLRNLGYRSYFKVDDLTKKHPIESLSFAAQSNIVLSL